MSPGTRGICLYYPKPASRQRQTTGEVRASERGWGGALIGAERLHSLVPPRVLDDPVVNSTRRRTVPHGQDRVVYLPPRQEGEWLEHKETFFLYVTLLVKQCRVSRG